MRMKTGIVAVVCLTSVAFGQGSLTPPGAPGETMKTLQQVEPRIDLATVPNYQITQSGSYYLSDNLVISNSIGISIGASDVTLDLNGFKIQHAGGQGGKAIYVSATRNVTIKNGSIQEFEDGVYMYGSDGLYPTQGARLENLNISRCSGYGLFVGAFSKVINCHFSEVRGAAAVFAAANSSIQNCTTDNSSGGYGFQLLNGARVFNCSAINSGRSGFYAGTNSVLSVCISKENTLHGFFVRDQCKILNSIAKNNKSTGITAGQDVELKGCTCTENGGVGVTANTRSRMIDCTISENDSHGVSAGTDAYLSGCTIGGNSDKGIYADTGAQISKCTITGNKGDGINVGKNSLVKDCVVEEGGSAGIMSKENTMITHCSVVENTGSGIIVKDGSSVSFCVVSHTKSGSSFYSAMEGINGTKISDCTLSGYGYGIWVSNRCSVVDCLITEMADTGIVLSDSCVIKGNMLLLTGTEGIEVWGDKSLITGNNSIQNATGIGVRDSGNRITDNEVTGYGTDYDIVSGNSVSGNSSY